MALGKSSRVHGGSISLVVDSTGLKILGSGEWNVHKYKASRKRRGWRKLHIGVDDEGFIVAAKLTARSGSSEDSSGRTARVAERVGLSTAGARGERVLPKSVPGGGLKARNNIAQTREAMIGCHIFNRMAGLGRPVSCAVVS